MAANGERKQFELEKITQVLHVDVKESKGMREATGVILGDPSFFKEEVKRKL